MNSRHIGSYGLIIKNEQIVLIKKVGGPYTGKLDLPGGTIEFGERPNEALIREIKEEVGVSVTKYELFDANSVTVKYYHEGVKETVHHLGIFYKIIDYEDEIKENIEITEKNDDSMGAKFYEIKNLKKSNLSSIAILELEKLGYKLDE